MIYKPEGSLFRTSENQRYISSPEGLGEAMEKGIILEARASVCTSSHDIIVSLPCAKGIIPREEGAIGISDGSTRDIALISRVNKTVCFKVTEIKSGNSGEIVAVLSRRKAQEECREFYLSKLKCGDITDARVTHIEQFGCFVDIGCGIPSLIPIDAVSVSRISSPADRFFIGQNIKAVVTSNDGHRICLSHKELLGTWEENAEQFHVGETVTGIVRSIEDYGIFVELAPNLAGLAELKDNIRTGKSASVYIKAIIPEKMKIKLIIVDQNSETDNDMSFRYFISKGHIDYWKYSPDSSEKQIFSDFT